MYLECLVIFGVTIFFFREYIFGKKPKNFPPGPMGYPLIGNLPQLGKNPIKAIKDFQETYGNIIGLRFGSFNVVILNGYETIKEALNMSEFSGRPAIGPLFLVAGKQKRGLVASEGPHWSEQRRFALRHLRDFGFGKKTMEGAILEDASDLITTLKNMDGAPISTDRMLSLVALSSLWYIVAGERLPINDPRTTELLTRINSVITSTTITGPVFFMPWLAQLAPKMSGWSRFETAIMGVKRFMREKIAEHKETRDPSNARDFMDVYLNEIETTTDKDSSFYKNVGDEHMLVAVMNLFGAGAETTSNTLNWSLFFLANNQEVQRKMQAELDAVVGKNRSPRLEDKDKLVYTEAVMLEVFRKSSIIPFAVFHNTMESVTFKGFELPKDTVVMPNLYDVHHDIKTWGDPQKFRPERFLSEDEKTVIKTAPVIPFSVGKRACLGETLARTTFYLVLTGVVQRFEISFVPNTPIDDGTAMSFIRSAPKNKLVFKDRFD